MHIWVDADACPAVIKASAPAGRRRSTTPIASDLRISSTGSRQSSEHNERMKLEMHSNSLFAVLLRSPWWDEFSVALAARYRREGYEVKRLPVGRPAGADFELLQGSRSTLLACKRWKATRTGVEPLRELEEARRALMQKGTAVDCIYVSTGEVTAQARAFAAERGIRVLEGAELARSVELAAKPTNQKAS